MTATIDYLELKNELVMFLRNSDIYTTTQRNVTTIASTGTVAGSSITINRDNVKNVRSLTVGSTAMIYGTDYLVNTDNSGTCLLSFTIAQSGSYTATLDYGSDKIFSDLPRNDLTISSFPRIAVDIIGDDSQDIELGANTKLTNISYAIYVYDFKVRDIDSTLTTIKNKMLGHQKGFYYQRYVTRIKTGPLMIWQVYGQTKVMFKAIDYISKFNYEYV